MQVSEIERKDLLKDIKNELVNLVSSRVVHPETNRLFPAKIIEEAIISLGFDVKINDSAKKQANYLIKELASKYLLKKADMEIKVTIREEWIHEGEKAEIEIPTSNAPAKDAQLDEGSDHEQPTAKEDPAKKQPKDARDKKAPKKKKNRKNSDEEWDKVVNKSDNHSKGFGRLNLNKMDLRMLHHSRLSMRVS